MRATRVVVSLLIAAACVHASAQESRPKPLRVRGEVILPPDVDPEMFGIGISHMDSPTSFSHTALDGRRFSYRVVPGQTKIWIDLAHWFFWDRTMRGQGQLVEFPFLVHGDGTTVPPGPFSLDVRPLVRIVWITVRDEEGKPLRDASVGPLAPSRADSGMRRGFDHDTPDMRLDKFTIETDKHGRAAVVIPVTVQTFPLVVFKEGFCAGPLRQPGLENAVVLERGAPVQLEVPSWLLERSAEDSCYIDLIPSSDAAWWKEQAMDVGDFGKKTFAAEPGDYTLRCRLVRSMGFLEPRRRDLDQIVPVTPSTLHIPDADDPLHIKVDLDRAAFDAAAARSGWKKPESRR